MRDISARELKGHNILAVERFSGQHTLDDRVFLSSAPAPTAAPAMKCGCFSRRTVIRPPFSARSAGKPKSSGMLMWRSRAMSSTLSRASAVTRKPIITTKGKE